MVKEQIAGSNLCSVRQTRPLLVWALALGVASLAPGCAKVPDPAAEAAERLEKQKATAQSMAMSAVQDRLNNPSSFEFVGISATPGKTSSGQPGWIVGLTYRATNGFGGVVTQNAIVSVDQSGHDVEKVVDVN